MAASLDTLGERIFEQLKSALTSLYPLEVSFLQVADNPISTRRFKIANIPIIKGATRERVRVGGGAASRLHGAFGGHHLAGAAGRDIEWARAADDGVPSRCAIAYGPQRRARVRQRQRLCLVSRSRLQVLSAVRSSRSHRDHRTRRLWQNFFCGTRSALLSYL